MKIITGLSEQPKQQSTLVLADGTRAVWSISYVSQQTGWFYDLSWNGTVIATGQRMVSSPNILRQYINKISFGIAVVSPNQLEPTTQTALVDGTVVCYLLEGADLQTIETTLFNAPPGQVQPVGSTTAGLPVVVLPANWGPAGGDLAYAYPNPQVVAMHEGTGQRLAFGVVEDGKFLKRVGATVIGATVAPGTGNVSGPASSTIGNVTVWADEAGTEVADGGTLGTAAFANSSSFLGATAAATGDLSGNYPDPKVAAIHTGATKLTIGSIANGQYLVRDGDTLIGSTPSGAGDVFGPSSTVTVGTVALFATTDGKTLGPSGITLGTIASQAASNVTITGGSIAGAVITSGVGGSISGVPINGSTIGAVTASTGRFTSVVSTGNISASGTITATGTIGASNFSGTSSGSNTGDQTNIDGNAATATALANARTIGGISFNGTANVTSFPVPGPIGGTTPNTGAFTAVGVSGSVTDVFTATTTASGRTAYFKNNTGYALVDITSSGTNQSSYLNLVPSGTGSGVIQLNGSDKLTISSTGFAVTGSITATTTAFIGTTSSFGGTVAQFNGANVVQANGVGMVSIASSDAVAADKGGSLALGAKTNGGAATNAYPMGVISGRAENTSNLAGYFAVATSDASGTIAEKLRINSSGNVGIGTSSPVVKLQVTTSGVAALPPTSGTTPSTGELIRLRTSSDTAGGIGTIGLSTNQMWLQACDATNLGAYYQLLLNPRGGNVGFNRTNPICPIDGKVAASATNVLGFNLSNDVNSNLEILIRNGVTTINAGGDGTLVFATESTVTERARITSAGLAVTGALSSTTTVSNGSLMFLGNQLIETSVNSNYSIAINYSGYNQGTTQFRDLEVYNGKAGLIAKFTGSNANFTVGSLGTGLVYSSSGTLTNTGTVAIADGGTGLTALGTAGQVLRVNAGATALEYATISSGSGTVTSVSVVNANGFDGTVATPTVAAAITLKTTVNGILKGNSTSGVVSAATSGTDYAPATSGSSILYGNGAGGFSNVTVGTGLTFTSGTLAATGGGGAIGVPTTGNQYGRLKKTISGTITASSDTAWAYVDVFNITDYGASPSASAATNTTAITDAFAAATVSGGCVFVPQGVFLCNKITVTITENVALMGCGQSASVLKFAPPSTGGNMGLKVTVTFGENNVRSFEMQNLCLWAKNSTDVSYDAGTAIEILSSTFSAYHFAPYAKILNCWVRSDLAASYWSKGISLSSTHNYIIDNCYINGKPLASASAVACTGTGIYHQNTIVNGIVTNSQINYWLVGIDASVYTEGLNVISNYFVPVATALKVSGNLTSLGLRGVAFYAAFNNMDCRGPGGIAKCFVLKNIESAVLLGNEMVQDGGSVMIDCERVYESMISSNTIYGSSTYGIKFATSAEVGLDSTANVVNGNVFRGQATNVIINAGNTGMIVTNNRRNATDASMALQWVIVEDNDPTGSNLCGEAKSFTTTKDLDGSTLYTFSYDITSCQLGRKPSGVTVSLGSEFGSNIVAGYDVDTSTKTSAKIKVWRSDGSALPSYTVRFNLCVNP